MVLDALKPIRLLTAVPLCDGHDSAISTINQELIIQGFEVVYVGYHRSAEAIVRAAIQEDVSAIGISSYNGGHIEFFREVSKLLNAHDRTDIGIFGGGGGTITESDIVQMKQDGVDEIFTAGTSLNSIVNTLFTLYGDKKIRLSGVANDSSLGQLLTAVESEEGRPQPPVKGGAKVIGITGPGGAGKTTLIDEWIRGTLREFPDRRIAVLSHDPSSVARGGLLGDRASMVYSEDDRVYIRSMATRGQQGGLSPATDECLQWIVSEEAGFDVVFIETVGTGQEALPFSSGLVDRKVLVLHPEYGSRLQLQKILMLDEADDVVINKSDWAGASRAVEEVKKLTQVDPARVFLTNASKHRDPGVVQLREEWMQ